MANVLEIYDPENNLVAYVTDENEVGGSMAAELISYPEATETIEADIDDDPTPAPQGITFYWKRD